MSAFEIINFYNSGAQAQVPSKSTNMTNTFTAAAGGGEPLEIGYEPKPNSKLASGASHDIVEHEGVRYLLLKGGHVYSVTIVVGDSISVDVVSAVHGHLSVPLPSGAEIDVVEHVEKPARADDAAEGQSEINEDDA